MSTGMVPDATASLPSVTVHVQLILMWSTIGGQDDLCSELGFRSMRMAAVDTCVLLWKNDPAAGLSNMHIFG